MSQDAAATGILVLVAADHAERRRRRSHRLAVRRPLHLIRRLVGLAVSMRDMASGDLEAPVTVSGNDEVTDMANALEVFRRYALEVQRLNLVEKLAQELDEQEQGPGTGPGAPAQSPGADRGGGETGFAGPVDRRVWPTRSRIR